MTMDMSDIAITLRAATDDLKRANDIADERALVARLNERWRTLSRLLEDEYYLHGPTDETNWRYRITLAKRRRVDTQIAQAYQRIREMQCSAP